MYWIDPSQEDVGTPPQRDFYCDTPDDIPNLPTSTKLGVQQGEDTVSNQIVSKGSSCFCIKPAGIYFLDSTDAWEKAQKEE